MAGPRKGPLYRLARRRALFGGSSTWRTVWGVMFGVRLIRRLLGDAPEVVYRERLRPGQVLVVRDGDRPVRVLRGETT
jgi:hypothetical protein